MKYSWSAPAWIWNSSTGKARRGSRVFAFSCFPFKHGPCDVRRQYLNKIFEQKGRPHPSKEALPACFFPMYGTCLSLSATEYKNDENMRLYKIFKEREMVSLGLIFRLSTAYSSKVLWRTRHRPRSRPGRLSRLTNPKIQRRPRQAKRQWGPCWTQCSR